MHHTVVNTFIYSRHGFSGGGGGGVRTPPEMICTPPEAFGTAPKSFCTPANYIYFDLIVSYLIILTTKFVKLPILWSQISPCRPTFPRVVGRCHHAPAKASSSTPPDIYPPPPERKYENPSLIYSVVIVLNLLHFILYNNATTGRFFHHLVCMNVCQGKQDLLVN